MRKLIKQWIPAIVSSYGILIWLEGMVGFAWTQYYSLLVLGSLAGSVLVVSGFTMVKGSTIGYRAALATTALLTVAFAYRLYATYSLMPAGMMAILSLILLILLIFNK